MRLDLFLFKNGLAKSRSQAEQIILSGVLFHDKIITKPAYNIDDDTKIEDITILNPLKYVSRGGYKLEYALSYFKLDVSNQIILDLGSSTGGFADCCIKHGAKKVYCIDIGTSQLAKELKDDTAHIVSYENTDARSIFENSFNQKFKFITSDLSFISQAKVYPNVSSLLCDDGYFISLVKPQFELDKNALSKKGIVLDKKNHEKVINNLISLGANFGLYLNDLTKSPIQGGDGNTEYLAVFTKFNSTFVSQNVIQNVIYK